MVIGFTGSREGMSDFQKKSLSFNLGKLIAEYCHEDEIIIVHGGCIGSDMELHKLVTKVKKYGFNIKIEVRPGFFSKDPNNTTFKGNYEKTANKIYSLQNHFARNRAIVQQCDILLACPSHKNSSKGGTWYTINYAKKLNKKLMIFYKEHHIEKINYE